MAGRRRAPHVRQHLSAARALGAASLRDDAVGAVERAAVLDLDEGARPIDGGPSSKSSSTEPSSASARRPARLDSPPGRARCRAAAGTSVGRRIDARQRRHRPTVRQLDQARQLGQQAALRLVVEEPGRGSAAASDSGSIATEQPVTRTCASGLVASGPAHGLARLAVGDRVTVQVLTTTRSAGSWASTSSTPRARSSRSTASISDWLTLQPRLAIAARRTGRGVAGPRFTARSYAR